MVSTIYLHCVTGLDEFIPLKPEEADDCKLAAFLDDHDFSFLFESTAQENHQVNSSSFRKLADSLHLIEVAAKYRSTETPKEQFNNFAEEASRRGGSAMSASCCQSDGRGQ